MARSDFGSVEEHGDQIRVRYSTPDGRHREGPFRTRADARRYLREVEQAINERRWVDRKTAMTLAELSEIYLRQRTVVGKPLSPRTVQTYRYSLDTMILPSLGERPLSDFAGPAGVGVIDTWHEAMRRRPKRQGTTGHTALRQAYRLLAGIFNEAIRKGLLPSNPCTIKGAGTATAPERELFSVDDIYDVADRVSGCMRCLILTAYWAHLRPGEAIATRRMDWDLEAGKVHVVRQQIDLKRAVLDQMREDGDLSPDLVVLEIPKSQQRRDSHGIDVPVEKNLKWDSQRHLHVPQPGLDVVAEHLAHSPSGFPTARLFTRADGTLLRTGYIDRVWSRARTAAGLPGIRFYDHRHTGLTKASDYGSTKEVMRRGGHSTTRAAMIYQHADAERDKEIARQIGDDFLQRRRKRRTVEGDSASDQH